MAPDIARFERSLGRRHPTGPAQVLLAMIAKKPSLVREMLR
jgi:putative transcriptional regulator